MSKQDLNDLLFGLTDNMSARQGTGTLSPDVPAAIVTVHGSGEGELRDRLPDEGGAISEFFGDGCSLVSPVCS